MNARMKRIRRPRNAQMGQTDRLILALRTTLAWVIHRRAALCGLAVILVLLFCLSSLCSSMYTSRVTLFLNYPEATDGLYPNQTRFNIYEFKSREVMEQAIAYAGLTGQVEPEALAECLSIRNVNATSVTGSSTFICTSYRITFTDRLHLERRSASTMLSLICKAYKDLFFSRYSDSQAALSFDGDMPVTEEYLMELDQIRLKIGQLNRYVSDRLKENKNFADPESGISFASLQQQLDNLLAYDVENLSSFILESGITQDRDSLLAVLSYKIRMNTLRYDQAMAACAVDNDGISLYDKAMSAVVMIPTTDEQWRYYMSRTRTGLDSLANHADGQLVAAAEARDEIEYDRYVSGKLSSAQPTGAQERKARVLLQTLRDRLGRIAEDIRTVDNAYIHQTKRNYITFLSNDLSFASSLQVTSAVSRTIMLLCALLLARLLYEWFRPLGRKEESGR